MSKPVWEGERLAQAKSLWDEGLSIADVGRALRVSKNAIAGLRKRQKWTPRKPPIELTSEQIAARTEKMNRTRRLRGPLPVIHRETAAKLDLLPTLPISPPRSCQWLIGKLFCGAPTEPRQPYCDTHCKLAFVHWPPRMTA